MKDEKYSGNFTALFVAGTQDCRHLGDNPADNLLSVLKQALEGGITCFQFRDKGKFSLENSPTEQRALAIKCRDLCRQYNVPLLSMITLI